MGVSDTSNVSNSEKNSDLPLENCENKSPVTHFQPQEKRKMGPVCTAHSLAFSPTRETKWKSMWSSVHIMLHVFLCVSCLWMWIAFVKFAAVPVLAAEMCLHAYRTHYICVCANGFTKPNVCNTVWVCCAEGLFSPFSLPLWYLCSLYRLLLSVCPLGQCLWTGSIKRPCSGFSGVCWKIPTWTQQTLLVSWEFSLWLKGCRFESLHSCLQVKAAKRSYASGKM